MKRNKEDDDDWGGNKKKRNDKKIKCILHSPSTSNFGNFTSFKNCKPSAEEKLKILQKIRVRRLKENIDSPACMQDVCDLIPDSLVGLDLEKTGWHRKCHQRFTMNLDRLQPESPDALKDNDQPSTSRSPRKKSSDGIIFSHDLCLFCNKKTWSNGIEKLPRPNLSFVDWCHKESGWKNIEPMARDLQNDGYGELFRKVVGKDLFASEAHFHKPCLMLLYGRHQQWSGCQSLNADEESKSIAAHFKAYESVKLLIQKEIIVNQKVKSLSVLRDHYIKQLEEQNHPNPNFRSEKLRGEGGV